MANLTIRDFPDELRDKLRVQAAQNGRSMEAEARRLLAASLRSGVATASDQSAAGRAVQDWVAKKLGPPTDQSGATDALIRDRRREVILEAISEGHDPEVYFGDQAARVIAEAGWTVKHVRRLTAKRAKSEHR
jgi:plasmid stability protein